jgi:hypothetical protein
LTEPFGARVRGFPGNYISLTMPPTPLAGADEVIE